MPSVLYGRPTPMSCCKEGEGGGGWELDRVVTFSITGRTSALLASALDRPPLLGDPIWRESAPAG